MIIYAIKCEFDNNEDYDLRRFGDSIIGYYATKELAIDVFNSINPQDVLSGETTWMSSKDINDYDEKYYEDKDDSDLPYREFECRGTFSYWVEAIEVCEKMEVKCNEAVEH